CSRDLCIADLDRDGRHWRVLATRSAYPVPWQALIAACASADIAISERRLPRGCTPRWLKLDAPVLKRTGGVAITLASGDVRTVRRPGDAHPWIVPPTIAPSRPWQGKRRSSYSRRLRPGVPKTVMTSRRPAPTVCPEPVQGCEYHLCFDRLGTNGSGVMPSRAEPSSAAAGGRQS
ncbi:MAG: hypothetical protein ACK4ZY_15225, partial [Sphingomonas sp.]